MRRLFRAEYFRLFHSWPLLALSLVFGVVSTLATGAKFSDSQGASLLLVFLCDRRYAALFYIVAGAYFFCMDFMERGFNQALYSGASRAGLLFVKHVCFLSLCAAISCISMATALIVCRASVGAWEPWFLIKLILFRLLVDMGFASVFTLFAYVLKKPSFMVSAGGAYALVLMFSKYANYQHWLPLAMPDPDYTPLILPLIMLVASPILAYAVFSQTELR